MVILKIGLWLPIILSCSTSNARVSVGQATLGALRSSAQVHALIGGRGKNNAWINNEQVAECPKTQRNVLGWTKRNWYSDSIFAVRVLQRQPQKGWAEKKSFSACVCVTHQEPLIMLPQLVHRRRLSVDMWWRLLLQPRLSPREIHKNTRRRSQSPHWEYNNL